MTENPPEYPAARQDPLDVPPSYLTLGRDKPVALVRLPTGNTAWLVTGHEAARQALSHTLLSADATLPGFPQFRSGSRRVLLPGGARPADMTFIQMDPPHHDTLRSMLRARFSARSVAALQPAMRRIADKLVDAMAAAGPPTDLISSLANPFSALVICEILGIRAEDREMFEHQAQRIMSLSLPQREIVRALRILMEYIDRIVRQAEVNPSDNLIGHLVREFFRPGQLGHDDLVATVRLLLIAGMETTANMIGVSFACLLRDRELYAELCRAPGKAGAVVEELLRFQAIAHHGVRRIAVGDVVIGGTAISKGDGVVVSLAAANRDPDVFEDPNRLDFGRDAGRHLSFSYGVHYCLGHVLARAELAVALATVANRFPGLCLCGAVEDLRFRDDKLVYGVHELPVNW